jgi:hypothetical protein
VALPADPATVAAFLAAGAQSLSAGALARRAAAIGAKHRKYSTKESGLNNRFNVPGCMLFIAGIAGFQDPKIWIGNSGSGPNPTAH